MSKKTKTPILNQVAGILKVASLTFIKKIRDERIAKKYKDIQGDHTQKVSQNP